MPADHQPSDNVANKPTDGALPLQVLQHYWRYPSFRPGQQEVIDSILLGDDTIALMATGAGKSLCFQVPALCLPGLTLVVSPLVALMKDQVTQLLEVGIAAAAVHSGLRHQELDTVLENAAQGVYKLLYVSPERLRTDLFLARMPRMNIGLLVVDEAHCISEWGHDFRPAYRLLTDFRAELPKVPCLAVTATATPQVLQDIGDQLGMESPATFVNSFWRANLSYSVVQSSDKEQRLLQMIQRLSGPTIIYVRSRRKAEDLADFLAQTGTKALPYHAGLDHDVRQDHAERFMQNRVRVIVATSAFGMGVNKPDIELVIHWEAPPTPEAYFQEAGRVGRNGNKAYAVWLYAEADFDLLYKQLDQSFPLPEQIRAVYGHLCSFLQLPVGAQPEEAIPLDLDRFCTNFKLPYTATWHALKRLETEGYIVLVEADMEPERFRCKPDRMGLYEVQLKKPDLEPLIKGLLRVYGGAMFTDFVPLLRRKLMQGLRLTEGQLMHQIGQLTHLEVIDYIPQYGQPMLWWAAPRVLPENLRIDAQAIASRKAAERNRIAFLADYAADRNTCRQQQLVHYFDVNDTNAPCGMCDTCQRKAKENPPIKTVRQAILDQLAVPTHHQDLIQRLHPITEDVIWTHLRRMLDEGLVSNQDGLISSRTQP